MENRKLASVVIPTYNAEKTIDRCLQSIVDQTYDNLQILCCDDCSKDGTWQKLQEWAARDSRIIVMRNDVNCRAAFSRNRCIECAEGEYVAQIDDDDYCALDRIEKQIEFLETHPEYDFCGTGIQMFDENGVYAKSSRTEGYAPTARDFLWSAVFCNPSMAYRRKALETVGGYRVAKETRRSQDYDMHMRMYEAGLRGYIMPELLTYYYRGQNSFPKCKYSYRIDEAKLRYKHFKKLGLMPRGLIYVLKPLILGLIPIRTLEKLKKRRNLRRCD